MLLLYCLNTEMLSYGLVNSLTDFRKQVIILLPYNYWKYIRMLWLDGFFSTLIILLIWFLWR